MMEIKILKKLPGYEVGDVVTIESVAEGVPKGLYWARRLEDAKIDGCVEIVAENKKSRKSVDVSVTDGGIDNG